VSGIESDVRNAVPTVPKKEHHKSIIKSRGLEFWNSGNEKPDRINGFKMGWKVEGAF
jgi:hypothetical protein